MPEPVPPRLRAAIVGLFAVVSFASLLGIALAPYLLVKSPLLLVAVSAPVHHVAMAAASVDPFALLVVTTLRRVLTGLAAYGLGYLYGQTAIDWVEQRYARLARVVRFVERAFARLGVSILIIAPAPTIAVFAGAARSRLPTFLLALTLGHVLYAGLTQYVGDMFSRTTELVTAFLGEYLLESTLICVVAVVAQQALAKLLRRRRETVP